MKAQEVDVHVRGVAMSLRQGRPRCEGHELGQLVLIHRLTLDIVFLFDRTSNAENTQENKRFN